MIQNIKAKNMKYLAVYVDIHNGLRRNISLFDTATTNPIKLLDEVSDAFGAVNLVTPTKGSDFLNRIYLNEGMYMAFVDMNIEWDTIRGEIVIIDTRALPDEIIVCSDDANLTFIGDEKYLPQNVCRDGIKIYNENPVFKYEGLK